jgi:hypothetical protein
MTWIASEIENGRENAPDTPAVRLAADNDRYLVN